MLGRWVKHKGKQKKMICKSFNLYSIKYTIKTRYLMLKKIYFIGFWNKKIQKEWIFAKNNVLHFVFVDCWCAACLQDYSVEGMSESLLTFLQHLREFGLVFQRKVRNWIKQRQCLVFILIMNWGRESVVAWRSVLQSCDWGCKFEPGLHQDGYLE